MYGTLGLMVMYFSLEQKYLITYQVFSIATYFGVKFILRMRETIWSLQKPHVRRTNLILVSAIFQ